ncbi:hypothetical protein VOLCADRAFT_95558 [Volvox carteri f. nagariensis]|uniref:Uncharacterized protein n=1 Tax=Volvox carteri f. nagariensis TaxID=3068 RepID=D8U7X8_VOLCA|nr:uncharacterized protein VOLCADRAFT_95558 [Volvox carteri f. nagariensis]EFJ44119.1 hypothetical protein VOLCADRAFT_95558 [Volvox carteri f. nagariensis]|eukprot:XP_002954713.1 hypothetical protein VOLCADRAFT_95558 [Volvox carteri f. nagariensis]
MAFLLSDAVNDSYSLLKAPRPSMQALMLDAITQQGKLTELVLKGQVELSRSIALCLEVLGLGTSSPDRHSAAARALVSLVTHQKLRPAVDNLLVMRRLCRIIELTDSATALAAAGKALFEVADDASWRTKGGSTAEILREALLRCVDTITSVAEQQQKKKHKEKQQQQQKMKHKEKQQQQQKKKHKEKRQQQQQQDAIAGKSCTSTRESGAEQAGTTSSTPPLFMESGATPDADQIALVTAAAAVLRPPVLHLLSPDQLQEASGALAACIASGCGCAEVLSALSSVVQFGPTDTDRVAAACAALNCDGMVAAIFKSVAAGTQSAKAVQATEILESENGSSSSSKSDGAACMVTTKALGRTPIKLTTSAQNALSCLAATLAACVTAGSPPHISTATSDETMAELLLPLLQLEPPEAIHTLRTLLLLMSLSSAPNGLAKAVAVALAPGGCLHAMSGAVLAAIKALLGDSSVADFADAACATSLLLLTTLLLETGGVTVEQLQEQATGLIQAAVGVVTGEMPGPEWHGLFTSVASQGDSSSSTRRTSSPSVRYPGTLRSAAAKALCPLLEWVSGQDTSSAGQPIIATLQPDKVADALIAGVMSSAGNVSGNEGILEQLCVLTPSLQLSDPGPRWAKFSLRDLYTLIEALLDIMVNQAADGPNQHKVPQLAAVMALSLWSRIPGIRGAGLFNFDDANAFYELLLKLVTAALQSVASAAASNPTSVQQLSDLAGVLNAVLGCLQPQLALSGNQCLPLSPALTEKLLPRQQVTTASIGVGDNKGVNLLHLRYDFIKPALSHCSGTQRWRSAYSSRTIYGPRPEFSLQLKWNFEVAPPTEAWTSFVNKLTEQAQGSSSIGYIDGHKTVATTTVEPLLQGLAVASSQLTEMIGKQLQPPSPAGREGECVLGLETAAVLRAAVQVAGNTAKVLALCVPPPLADINK